MSSDTTTNDTNDAMWQEYWARVGAPVGTNDEYIPKTYGDVVATVAEIK
ncbi:MAG: hypothetical protein GY876_10545 [Planctomycetes bacterium]|nr:hypothetical protein [Planctomycetota bacterium]